MTPLRRFCQPLHALLRDHYTAERLAPLLLFQLNERLDAVTPADAAYDTVVFRLVLWADQTGRLLDLARAAAADLPGVPSAAALARTMETAAGGGPQPAPPLGDELEALARAYERIQVVIPKGHQRTALMEEIVSKMRAATMDPPAVASCGHLSTAEGDRLLAIVSLIRQPDPAYLGWLAERLVVENGFTGFRAAVALWAAARSLPGRHLDAVLAAAQAAIGRLPSTGRPNSRDKLEQAIAAVARRTARPGGHRP